MGIYLVDSDEQLKATDSRHLVQEYVADPYLLSDGLKFDLRIYAVIKSINPLSIYVAREGGPLTTEIHMYDTYCIIRDGQVLHGTVCSS